MWQAWSANEILQNDNRVTHSNLNFDLHWCQNKSWVSIQNAFPVQVLAVTIYINCSIKSEYENFNGVILL